MMDRSPFRGEQTTLPEHAVDRDAQTLPPSGSRLPIAERLVLRDLGRMDPGRQSIAAQVVTALSQMEGRDVDVVHALAESLAAHARRAAR